MAGHQPTNSSPGNTVEEDNTDILESIAEAIRAGDLNTVKNWLEATPKPDVNVKLQNCKTPLHLAADQKDEQLGIVEALLEGDADADLLDDHKYTAMHYAAEHGHMEVVKKMLEHRNKRMRPRMGSKRHSDTPVHIAAAKGHLRVLQEMIQKEPKCVTFSGSNDETPLHHAARAGHVEVMEEILSVMNDLADVDELTKDEHTALYYAAEKGHVGVVEKLLQHRVKVMGTDKEAHARMGSKEGSDTPAHIAAANGHLEVLQVMTAKEPDYVTFIGSDGETPLHHAAKAGHVEVVEEILSIMKHDPKFIAAVDQLPVRAVVTGLMDQTKPAVSQVLLTFADQVQGARSLSTTYTDVDCYTPLYYAAKHGHVGVVEKLLQHRAEVMGTDKEAHARMGSKEGSDTPAHIAAERGNLKVLQVMIQKEPNCVTFSGSNGETPLHHVAKAGHVEIVDEILSLKCSDSEFVADIDQLTKGTVPLRFTALYYAAECGHVEVVKKLLEHRKERGLNVMVTSKPKERMGSEEGTDTPAHIAAANGHLEVLQEIIKEEPECVKCVGIDGETPLHHAAKAGHVDVVEQILCVKVLQATIGNEPKCVTFIGINDKTPLYHEAKDGLVDSQVVEQILSVEHESEFLADVDHLDNSNLTALYYAAECGHVEVIKKLLEHRAKKQRETKTAKKPRMGSGDDCDTPVHIAASKGHLKVLQELIRSEPECVTFTGTKMKRPLHHAAKAGHVEIVELILSEDHKLNFQEDVDSPAEDSFCHTALHYAAKHGHLEVVKKLLQHRDERVRETKIDKEPRMGSKPNTDTPAHVAASMGHLVVLQELVQREPDCVTFTGINKETPLHVAASKSSIEILEEILSVDCESQSLRERVNSMAADSETPLHRAAERGSKEVVEILLKHGAEINPIGDEHTKTPFHKAVLYGYPELALFLLKKGARINPWAFQEVINKGYEQVAREAIETKHWPCALRWECNYKRESKESTAFRELILKMPDVAKVVLDRCIIPKQKHHEETEHNAKMDHFIIAEQKHDEKLEHDVHILYYYEFLEDFKIDDEQYEGTGTHGVSYNEVMAHKDEVCKPSSCNWPSKKFTKDNHPLQIMVKKERHDLLTHPVVLSLIHDKWKCMGRSFYYTNLIIYIIYLIFLTTFALIVPNPQSAKCCNVTRFNCSNDLMNSPEGSRGVGDVKGSIIAVSVFVFLLALLRLFLELVQLLQQTVTYVRDHKSRHSGITRYLPQYLSDWENWVEIVHYICSLLFVIFVWAADSFCVADSKWQVGVCAMFLCWFVFILFVSKLPIIGIYVIILLRITWTFVKLIVLAALLVVAFGLTFFMMFSDFNVQRSPFSDVGRSLLKTMTMTTGELDYDAIFRIDPAGGSDDLPEIPFPPISYIVWIVFIIMMPVILTNMLTSLAIEDTSDVLRAAKQEKLALQVDLVLTIEEVQIFFDSWKCLPSCFKRSQPLVKKVYPNNERQFFSFVKNESLPDRLTRWLEKLRILELEFWGGDRYDQLEDINSILNSRQNEDGPEVLQMVEDGVRGIKTILDPPEGQSGVLQKIGMMEQEVQDIKGGIKTILDQQPKESTVLQRITILESDVKGIRGDIKQLGTILQELTVALRDRSSHAEIQEEQHRSSKAETPTEQDVSSKAKTPTEEDVSLEKTLREQKESFQIDTTPGEIMPTQEVDSSEEIQTQKDRTTGGK